MMIRPRKLQSKIDLTRERRPLAGAPLSGDSVMTTETSALADNSASDVHTMGGRETKVKGQVAHLGPGRSLGAVNVVAGKLSCSARHVYRLADGGRMPSPIRLGALVRWDLDEIDRWIAVGCPSCRKGTGR